MVPYCFSFGFKDGCRIWLYQFLIISDFFFFESMNNVLINLNICALCCSLFMHNSISSVIHSKVSDILSK